MKSLPGLYPRGWGEGGVFFLKVFFSLKTTDSQKGSCQGSRLTAGKKLGLYWHCDSFWFQYAGVFSCISFIRREREGCPYKKDRNSGYSASFIYRLDIANLFYHQHWWRSTPWCFSFFQTEGCLAAESVQDTLFLIFCFLNIKHFSSEKIKFDHCRIFNCLWSGTSCPCHTRWNVSI